MLTPNAYAEKENQIVDNKLAMSRPMEIREEKINKLIEKVTIFFQQFRRRFYFWIFWKSFNFCISFRLK